MISLELFGDPIPAARPKFRRIKDFVSTYDPQAKLKEGYRWQLQSQYRELPITTPVAVVTLFFMPIPKSTSGIRRRQMLSGLIQHDKRPDVDNLQKFVLDCLHKLVIQDDSQIVDLRGRKIYATKPGTIIRIVPYDQVKELQSEDISRTD
jgi:Holliday junction resolvase RusA-like endonuclease